MATGVRDGDAPGAEKPPRDGRLIVKWIELQESSSQAQYTKERLDSLLLKAAQPWHSSKNACIELCYFIEQCRTSRSSLVQDVVFSKSTSLSLFNFYVEWNEKTQNRQTKQVLELLASLIAHHPEESIASPIKEAILLKLVSIITHQAAQPLVKPAFKALDLFLSKGTLSPKEVVEAYEKSLFTPGHDANLEALASWDLLISDIFDWMTLPEMAPAAGKCLVTLFGQVKIISHNYIPDSTLLWQRWIRNGLDKDPDALENVKNYLFPPLFKFDRSGSILFLEDLNKQKPMSDLNTRELNAHSLLQLAAMEAGKKAGLVEEPSTIQGYKTTNKAAKYVVLQEDVIGSLSTCAVDTVRSLAFSVLVASPSPLRPFSPLALDILQSQMEILYADTDAKFRTDVLSNTRQMIERIRGTTAYLNRELGNLSFKNPPSATRSQEEHDLYDNTFKLLRRHEEFIEWYLEFLLGELIPTVSYQRHITALKAIELLLRSGILNSSPTTQQSKAAGNATTWSYSVDFFTSRSMRLLLDLLMDPFEDVRGTAAAVLKLASIDNFAVGSKQESAYHKPRLLRIGHEDHSAVSHRAAHQIKSGTDLGSLAKFISRAEDLAKRTGRADYADGVARCYELRYSLLPSTESRLNLVKDLVHDLETKIRISEQDLTQAVLDAPVHGTFAALTLVWESIDLTTDFKSLLDKQTVCKEWEILQELILSLCSRIWTVVRDVLCNDSPEGHLPQDLDDINTVDTKDVLSYSFRAVHESSNLMRNIASKVKSTWQDGSTIIPLQVFKGIGELTFEQLSSLRHRGAFSTVTLTFARCCQLTQTQVASDKLMDSSLLEKWYQGTLTCIFEQASTTRRSAGIPALMTSILSANSDKPAFRDVMAELISLARQPVELSEKDETNLPQVHGMNCLKEIFKSSTLGKKSEGHIADCLQLAADSLNSEIWAIRNCGLLLLRSLIDCLFGTSESKAITEAGWDGRSIRLSYDRYPSLPELLLKLLDTNTSGLEIIRGPVIGAVESVFPALDIVRRAGPPPTHHDEIFTLVSMHLGSRIWYVREIAARTICTLLLHDDWLSAVMGLIDSSHQSSNHLHGVLMAVRFILERRLELDPLSATDGLLHITSMLKSPKSVEFVGGEHPEILAAALEVNNTIAKILLCPPTTETEKGDASHVRSITSHLFADNAFDEFSILVEKHAAISTETPATAALGKAIVRRGIYTTALLENEGALQNIVSSIAELNTDMVLTALDCLPSAWKNLSSSKTLCGLSRAYISLLVASKAPEVRAVACYDLADVLDKGFVSIEASGSTGNESNGQPNFDLIDITKELSSILQGNDSPSFSNAQIRISGCIMICQHISQAYDKSPTEPYRSQMKEWGQLVSAAGQSSNDFDTRHAAAAALQSFYSHPHITQHPPADECTLHSLLALYDTLNDDDDEIRDLSAATVSRLLQKSLVPLAARVELVNYAKRLYGHSLLFAWSVILRMTGSDLHPSDSLLPRLEPVEIQFSKALKDDDSLFVEEEQNLFIDEVRETSLWIKAFESLGVQSRPKTDAETVWVQPCAALSAWIVDGLMLMTGLLDKEDGPLGWLSKPAVFSSCMRVLLSANAITQRHEYGLASNTTTQDPGAPIVSQIMSAMEKFLKLGRERNVHSGLLFGTKENPHLLSELR